MLKYRENKRADSLDADFERAFERYYPRVSRFFSRRGFSSDECQDLAQKTFLKVYRGWARHRQGMPEVRETTEPWERYRRDRSPEERETSWIFTIALNVFRNEVRHANAQKRDGAEKPLEQLREKGWEPTAPESSPEVGCLARQRVELLAETMDELPPGMRRVFELRFAHGLKYREIANVMSISIQAVRSQLHGARKRLEKLLVDR